MTELDIASSIMNVVTSHEGVTNVSLSEDQISDEVDTLRARMILELDQTSHFRRPYLGYTQTISNLTVVKAKDKTPTVTIPRVLMKLDNTPAILYVGGKDGNSPYRVIAGESSINATHDQFIGNLPIALYKENKIELYQTHPPNEVMIIAVFEDPSELEIFGVYDSEKDNYPMPNALLDKLIGKTIESYMRTLYRVPIQPNVQADIPQQAQTNAGPNR